MIEDDPIEAQRVRDRTKREESRAFTNSLLIAASDDAARRQREEEKPRTFSGGGPSTFLGVLGQYFTGTIVFVVGILGIPAILFHGYSFADKSYKYILHALEADRLKPSELPNNTGKSSFIVRENNAPKRVIPVSNDVMKQSVDQVVKLAETKTMEAAKRLTIANIEGAITNPMHHIDPYIMQRSETTRLILPEPLIAFTFPPDRPSAHSSVERTQFSIKIDTFNPYLWGDNYKPEDFVKYGSPGKPPQFYLIEGKLEYPAITKVVSKEITCRNDGANAPKCGKLLTWVRDKNKKEITTDIIIAAIDKNGKRIVYLSTDGQKLLETLHK